MDCKLLVRNDERGELEFMPVSKMVGQARVALALLCDRTHNFTTQEIVNEIGIDSENQSCNFVGILNFTSEDLAVYYASIAEILEELPPRKKSVIQRLLDSSIYEHTFEDQVSQALSLDSSYTLKSPLRYIQKLYADLGPKLAINARRILVAREARCCNPGCENSSEDICKGCYKVLYCSTSCQRESWRAGHKEECRKVDVQNKIGAVESAAQWSSVLRQTSATSRSPAEGGGQFSVEGVERVASGAETSDAGGGSGAGGTRNRSSSFSRRSRSSGAEASGAEASGAGGATSAGGTSSAGGASSAGGTSGSNFRDVLDGGYAQTFYMPRY
jgi:hypothetical protein